MIQLFEWLVFRLHDTKMYSMGYFIDVLTISCQLYSPNITTEIRIPWWMVLHWAHLVLFFQLAPTTDRGNWMVIGKNGSSLQSAVGLYTALCIILIHSDRQSNGSLSKILGVYHEMSMRCSQRLAKIHLWNWILIPTEMLWGFNWGVTGETIWAENWKWNAECILVLWLRNKTDSSSVA